MVFLVFLVFQDLENFPIARQPIAIPTIFAYVAIPAIFAYVAIPTICASIKITT